jgi:hypothetical protein
VRGCCLPELCRSRGAAAASCTPALRGVRTGEGSALAARLQQEMPVNAGACAVCRTDRSEIECE